MAGRPTDYTPEVVEEAWSYLEDFKEEHEHSIPSVVGLCMVLGKARSTLYKWAGEDDKAEFSDILEAIQERQELELLNMGLRGAFNASICKLALGKHGYHDKVDSTVSGTQDVVVELVQPE